MQSFTSTTFLHGSHSLQDYFEYRYKTIYENELTLSAPLVYDFYSNIQIKEWINNFTNLGEKRTGYRKEQVTVYMHAAAYHIPQMVAKNDNIKQFSGQGNKNLEIVCFLL